jgi:hypothetical protein
MAGRNPQSHAKRARELAVKERRDRKRERKAEASAQHAAADESRDPPSDGDQGDAEVTTAAEESDERISS